jgi:hypothetical protein
MDGEDVRSAGGIQTYRRRVLAALGGVGLATGLGIDVAAATGTSEDGDDDDRTVTKISQRVRDAFRTRTEYSEVQLLEESDTTAHDSNPRLSERRVVAKFGKSLPHENGTGLPTTGAYDDLVAACETGGENIGYQEIPQALADSRPLAQPESAWSYLTEGASTATLRIATPPAFDDPEAGAEMVELYWRALTRDVKFRDYPDDSLVAAAAAELDGLDAYDGPGADSEVTPGNVFRGVTPGATTGPYVSQLLWKDRELGGGIEDQKLEYQGDESTPADYMTTVEDWLKLQRGVAPPDDGLPGNEYTDDRRYIVTGRDMCERVHDDPPFRQVQKAAQVLVFTMNAPLDEGIPYTLKPFGREENDRRNRENFLAQTTLPFNDFGPLYIEKKVLEASEHGQKAAWHKKWNVHRRLRPEEYGGRVQAVKTSPSGTTGGGGGNGNDNGNSNGERNGNGNDNGNDGGGKSAVSAAEGSELTVPEEGYPIPDNLLGSEALERTNESYGSYLLPQAYAEGSPTHPSYPAGHSVVAGAGVTVLKAIFDGDYVFPTEQKVVPTRDGSELRTAAETDAMGIDEELTVRGELNKLASNMALGRNRAGIHYRTDGIEGLRLGEAAAIDFLEDQLTLPDAIRTEYGDVTLTFETFDSETVTITPTV